MALRNCPVDRCGRALEDGRYFCTAHWMSLPAEYRRAFLVCYTPGPGLDKEAADSYYRACLDYLNDRQKRK